MVKLILIGAGQRGADSYAPYALHNSNDLQIVGVAEPLEERRKAVADLYNIPRENVFSDWRDILKKEKFADGVILATQDTMHYEPTLLAMEKGYHVLCEKPMSPSVTECIEMGKAAKKYDRILAICHVLRYTPFFEEVKRIIDEGTIGEVMAVQMTENVAYWHQAHSFVRGNWRRADESSPMILAKSCHDMDMLLYLIGKKCTHVSSFGELTHFKSENAPKGAAKRCLDGCVARHECPYYAPRIYVNWTNAWQAEVVRRVVSSDITSEGLMQALKTGPYGRCVYHCDNDVVDHQVVNLNFEGGAVASFTMCGFTFEEGRTLKVMGTKGEIKGVTDSNKIEYFTYLGRKKAQIVVTAEGGHMGGDSSIMRDFIEQIASNGAIKGKTSAEVSVESHLIALAAEKSRIENKTIILNEFAPQ